MPTKTIIMGTTFNRDTFKKRALSIIAPFIDDHLIEQILCVNLDPQRTTETDCSVALYARENDFLTMRDCVGETAAQPLDILHLTDAAEALDPQVDPDSIFLHRF